MISQVFPLSEWAFCPTHFNILTPQRQEPSPTPTNYLGKDPHGLSRLHVEIIGVSLKKRGPLRPPLLSPLISKRGELTRPS